MSRITGYALNFEREPLKRPFGFKGDYLSELWQIVCQITLNDGRTGIGVGVQSVLWSSAETFCSHSQTGGNTLMLSVTEYALKQLRGRKFTDPLSMQKEIEEPVYRYACKITENESLPRTFILNAMVAIDFALWQLWSEETGKKSFDQLCARFCPALTEHQAALGEIPLISYAVRVEEIQQQLNDGAFILKIKIGSNPGGNNNLQEMCQWDINRIKEIHVIASQYETPYTDCGHPVYYLDANGRYPDKKLLMQFLDGIEECGALGRIVLLEEPFSEVNIQDVADLPVRVVGDESAQSAADVAKLIDEYHYGAIALKPIAKTLSKTLEIYKEAKQRDIPCFCADLTVPPVMLEWNMQVAARLPAIPGLEIGILESNGPQNYCDWEKLLEMDAVPQAQWIRPQQHLFQLNNMFYTENVPFKKIPQYEKILK